MNSEIEDLIKKCPTWLYLTFRNRQRSELVINCPVPNQALDKNCCGSFLLYGHYYLLTIDYYSIFIVIETIKNLQLSTVIN